MHKYALFAPPVSLGDLAQSVGLPALGRVVACLPGACAQEPKHNETWRYLFRSCTLIGYKHSAVVAGDHAPQVCAVARVVRAAVLGPMPVSLSHSETIALMVPDPSLLHIGASYDVARDWTAQPWAEAWIAHQRAQERAPRQMCDPFAWAVSEGLADG